MAASISASTHAMCKCTAQLLQRRQCSRGLARGGTALATPLLQRRTPPRLQAAALTSASGAIPDSPPEWEPPKQSPDSSPAPPEFSPPMQPEIAPGQGNPTPEYQPPGRIAPPERPPGTPEQPRSPPAPPQIPGKPAQPDNPPDTPYRPDEPVPESDPGAQP